MIYDLQNIIGTVRRFLNTLVVPGVNVLVAGEAILIADDLYCDVGRLLLTRLLHDAVDRSRP